MNLQAKVIVTALCFGALPFAQAADFEDFGRVVRVTPQVEQINSPRQECRDQTVNVQQPAERSAGGSIIGGIAGALLGSQVGGGNGRIAAAAGGAIAGAVVGDRVDNRDNQGTVTQQNVRQCRTVDHYESRTTGYQVAYDYNGRTYTSNMSYDPGNRIKLRVSIDPAQP